MSEWITRKEAMDILGAGKSYISRLVSSGRVATQDKLISKRDILALKATSKHGPKRMVAVSADGETQEYPIIDSIDLGEAEFVHLWITELESAIAAFVYRDGSVVTTDDWQGLQPEHIVDVKDYGWMLCTPDGYEPCTFVDGLPRSVVL